MWLPWFLTASKAAINSSFALNRSTPFYPVILPNSGRIPAFHIHRDCIYAKGIHWAKLRKFKCILKGFSIGISADSKAAFLLDNEFPCNRSLCGVNPKEINTRLMMLDDELFKL